MQNLICDKKSYEKPADAAGDLSGLRKRQKKHDYKIYKCPFCNYYHIQTINKKVLRTPKKIDKYPIKWDYPKQEKKKK